MLVDSYPVDPSVENLQCLPSSGSVDVVPVSGVTGVTVPVVGVKFVPFVVVVVDKPLLLDDRIERVLRGESQEVVIIKRARTIKFFFINSTFYPQGYINTLILSAEVLDSLGKKDTLF